MTSGTSRPADLSREELAASLAVGSGTKPNLEPPANVAATKGVTAWASDKRVTALWTIAEVRNAWMNVDGIGWRRLANNSDSGIMALNCLASLARQTNARVDYDEDANAMIDQIYVW